MRARGYLHSDYVASLSHAGQPRHLQKCDGWVLERSIAGTLLRDATGCYPLFCCRDWNSIVADLEAIGDDWVSLVLVTDPFGDWNPDTLSAAFPDLVRRFKTHQIIDLSKQLKLGSNHRRNISYSLRHLEFEVATDPLVHIDRWCALYADLVQRHRIVGIADFPRRSFEKQLITPGISAIVARRQGQIVGMTLWYRHDDHVYYHLAGYSEEGYAYSASFGLFWTAVSHFSAEGLRYLSLGSGLDPNGEDGLSRFKRSWANQQRDVYLCGRIFDRRTYVDLANHVGAAADVYFPSYRS
jgi:hypothetical protein